jgi:hypothetical protein
MRHDIFMDARIYYTVFSKSRHVRMKNITGVSDETVRHRSAPVHQNDFTKLVTEVHEP